jgi:hypothetical protein
MRCINFTAVREATKYHNHCGQSGAKTRVASMPLKEMNMHGVKRIR